MTAFPIETWDQVTALIEAKVEEGQTLDYKRELHLDTRDARVEVLKDLSGMGNGGGGTVLFGVAEVPGSDGVPDRVAPMADRTLPGVLEDIVRASVSPPLLLRLKVVESSHGFVMCAEVRRSPLGPYMVEAHGERRYHIRMGTRTVPMTERQIHDAYALAVRTTERREALWRSHHLPLVSDSAAPWLSISALPHEPLNDLIDLAAESPESFAYPDQLEPQAQAGGFYSIPGHLRLWGDGVMAEDVYEGQPECLFRLHRDGAVALGISIPHNVPLLAVCRALNAHIVYLSWLWERIGLRSLIEVRAQLENLQEVAADPKVMGEDRRVRRPWRVPFDAIRLTAEFIPRDLGRARIRHLFVRDFGDRLHQAFGYARANALFRVGWLYGRNGLPIGLSIGGSGIWDRQGTKHGNLYQSGLIRNYHRDSQVLGYLVDGAVVDEHGRTMACIEMATGQGVPDGFLQRNLTRNAKYAVPVGGAGEPFEDRQEVTAPLPLGVWSEESLVERLGIQLPGAA